MKVVDTIHLSVETFRSRKSRTLLTILGVGVGIGAVLFLVSLGYGLQNTLLERITTAESFLALDVVASDDRVITLNNQSLKKIAQVPHVVKISPQAVLTAETTLNNLTAESTLNLVETDYFSLSGFLPTLGRNFQSGDQGKLIVNSKIAELFSLQPSQILGQRISFTVFYPRSAGEDSSLDSFTPNQTFEVVGVVDEQDGLGQIYMLRSDLSNIPIIEYQLAKIKVDDSRNLEIVREDLINLGLVVSALSDIVDQANSVFRIIQIILGIFGVIAVVVAAISLANTMTISLLERTHDIGVMRALGAAPKDVRNLFLIESTLIGFSGGIAGILLGFLAAFLFNTGLRLLAGALGGQAVDLFSTPAWFLIFIIVFSTTVGFLTGIVPSKRASRVDPLVALKYH